MGSKKLRVVRSKFHKKIFPLVEILVGMGHEKILTVVKEHQILNAEIDSFSQKSNVRDLKIIRLQKKQEIRGIIKDELGIAV